MGWGKLLGDLAKDYISERGIGGALEDAGSIKDGFSKLFGSNDDGYDEEAARKAYMEDWNQTTEAISSYENDGEFKKAIDVLDAFYAKYEENHDFWYNYYQAHVVYRRWGAAYAPLLEDDNTTLWMPDDVEKMREKVDFWLGKLQSEASEENEVNAAKELASTVKDEDELIYFTLREHKAWFDINQLTDPNKIVSRSKIRDFNQALNKIKELYNDGYWRNEGLVRVYILMLRAARDKESFLKELAHKFTEVRKNVERSVENLRNSADNDQRQHASDLASTATDLLRTIDDKIKNSSATKKPQPAAQVDGNDANEKEYLEEIKTCLADDGTISDRVR